MDKRLLTLILLIVLVVTLVVWIKMFVGPDKVKREEQMLQDPETHNFEKVLPYENAYMGNASNIGNLYGTLPLNNYKGTFEMDPEIFLLVMNYNTSTKELGEAAKQVVIYNTTATFTLIRNVEIIEIRFQDRSYTVTRDNVEKWFKTPLVDFKDPVVFKERVQDRLDENIDEWVAAYTEGY